MFSSPSASRPIVNPWILWGVPALYMAFFTVQAIAGLGLVADIGTPLVLGWMLVNLIPVLRLRQEQHVIAILFYLGIAVFTGLEIAWAILDHSFVSDPTDNPVLTLFYLVPNLLFFSAIILFAKFNRSRGSSYQFMTNLVTASLITVGVVTYLFFDWQLSVDFDQMVALAYLIIDMISLSVMLAIVAFALPLENDSGYWLALLALFQYYTADLLYVFQVLNDLYVPNGLADWLYVASLLLLAISLVTRYRNLVIKRPGLVLKGITTSQTTVLVLLILSLPILVLVVRGIKAAELLYFSAILVIYLLASLGNQNRLALEKSLAERTEHNDTLQQRVLERTSQLQDLNDDLSHALCHDGLTGLYSRNFFLSLVDREILKATAERPVYLAIIDLARFRMINDLYTQEVGDQVLQEVALLMDQFQTDQNTLAARLGGDEFALLCSCSPDLDIIRNKMDHLLGLFARPLRIDPFSLQIGVHIGIAAYPENASDRTNLLKCAKTAVEQAKGKRSNSYSFYDQKTHAAVRRRNDIEMALRRADIPREFSLHYQPLFSADGQILKGMEALLRWNSPLLGTVSPGEFIPAAEETGEILKLGQFVMREAMWQISEWNIKLGLDLRMGINISPLQLENGDFMSLVREAIHLSKAKPDWIIFEITEGLAMLDPETSSEIFQKLKDIGLSIAIDDFGSGYSTYAYLKQFRVDHLKIDKRLIDTIATDTRDAQIIQAIIDMARALQIKTTAEGVEHQEQAQLLIQLGCDEIQGYLYGCPLPKNKFASYLEEKFS